MSWIVGRRYQIIYLDQNNQLSARKIKVLQERRHILLAYCYEKQEIRSFIKENILGFTIVGSIDERRYLGKKYHF